jgi:hypothetical protein
LTFEAELVTTRINAANAPDSITSVNVPVTPQKSPISTRQNREFQDALFNPPSCDSDHAMPRRPLAEITDNRASNCELSSHQRAKIDRSRELGQRPQLIAERLNLPPSTVYYTLDKIDARNQGHSLLRLGRPLKWTEHDKRRIIQFVRINPKSTYEEIRQNLYIYLSSDTFRRILDTVDIKN